MNPSLPALIARLHAFSGIAHKRDIQQVARELRDAGYLKIVSLAPESL